MSSLVSLVLALYVAFCLSATGTCRAQYPPSSNNVTGNYTHTPSLRSLMIAELKARILKHLKFSEPVIDNSAPGSRLSKDVVPILSEELDLTDSTPRENIIVHAYNRNFSCLNSNDSTCQRFEFTADTELESIISVHIWLHRRRPFANLKLSIYSSSDPDSDLVIQMKEHHAKFQNKLGWITFELPKYLAIESRQGEIYCTVEVEGSSIDKKRGLSPFLVIARTLKEQRRKRQTTDSDENCDHCCTESLNVTVEELAWHNWVISPREFNIKTCRGQCPDTLSFHGTKYQSIMNTLHKVNSSAYPKPDCAFWTPSCRPTRYLPLRLMYDYNGTVHDQEIPYAIIESCQCQ